MPSKHTEFRVWKESMDLAISINRETGSFPKNESWGLVSQMRRAAYSIPSNIAEGHGRGAALDFNRFVRFALGSCAELETQIKLATEMGYLGRSKGEALIAKCDHIGRMLNRLSQYLVRDPFRANKKPRVKN